MKIATVCTGIGSPEMAIRNLGIEHEINFACEIDKYARETYLANFDAKRMLTDMTKESWEGEEFYSDLFIGGIPCQAFSLAGKRLGELDPRGLLFFDFYRYVKNQQPKYFIIENVKGLLSDNDGNTFQNWINLLGQSVNGDQFMFHHEDSLMYNLHWQVLNTKDYGLPQNRERVFLIGIRNDLPNTFVFPKKIPLELRLKDILEDEVDEKYYLSDKMLNYLTNTKFTQDANLIQKTDICGALLSTDYKSPKCVKVNSATASENLLKNVGNIYQSGGQNGNIYDAEGISPTLASGTTGNPKNGGIGSNNAPKVMVKSATASGYEVATEGDSINLEHPNSETRRGRVGKQVAQTLTTSCNQGVMVSNEVIQINPSTESGGVQPYQQNRIYDSEGIAPALCRGKSDLNITEPKIGAFRGRNPQNPIDRTVGAPTQQMLEINENGTSNRLTSVQKDNVVVYTGIAVYPLSKKLEFDGFKDGNSPTLLATDYKAPKCVQYSDYRIRKLTPLECFRLQGFPDSFVLENKYKESISKLGINAYICKELLNKLKCENVQLKTAIENTLHTDIVLCTIKDGKNTETQTLYSSIPTEETKNVQFQIAISQFTQLDSASHITTQTENTEILLLLNRKEKSVKQVQIKEFWTQKGSGGLENTENQNTELIMKITLGENCRKMKQSTIITAIQTIMKSKIFGSINQNQNTLKFIVNYEDYSQTLHQDLSKTELLCLRMGNISWVSSSQLYKQAGNSISVPVIQAILKNLLTV